MSTAPASKPNRVPWIIVGVLGCVVVCLFVAFIAAAGYAMIGSQPTPVAKSAATSTPTRVPFGLANSTNTTVPFPTQTPIPATPVVAEPTKLASATALPTASKVPPAATKPPAPPSAAAPSGKIAFSKREGDRPEDMYVWVMNADGSGAKKVLDRASHPTFSPDGTKIAYYHWTDGIYVANADGTDPKKVLGETFSGGDYGSPAWSHDGRFIAVSTQPGGKGNIIIDTVPPDGSVLKDSSARRNITIGEGPSWSPDDTQITFHSCRGNSCGIFKSSTAPGSEAIPVIGDDGGMPAWSPDGKRLVYQKEIDGQKQLFVINPDGSGKKQLTSGAALHVDAIWSLDGNYIFYRSPEASTWAIWRMNADGTRPIKLIDNVVPVNWPYERLAVGK